MLVDIAEVVTKNQEDQLQKGKTQIVECDNYEELLNQDFSSTEEALDTFITVYKDAGKYSDAIRKTAKLRRSWGSD